MDRTTEAEIIKELEEIIKVKDRIISRLEKLLEEKDRILEESKIRGEVPEWLKYIKGMG